MEGIAALRIGAGSQRPCARAQAGSLPPEAGGAPVAVHRTRRSPEHLVRGTPDLVGQREAAGRRIETLIVREDLRRLRAGCARGRIETADAPPRSAVWRRR